MHTCMYKYKCMYMCVHTANIYICMFAYNEIVCMYTLYLYKIVCIKIRNSLNVYILMPAWIHGVIQDSLNVHTHIRFCIYIYMCIYIYPSIVESMYVYIHTCTHSQYKYNI